MVKREDHIDIPEYDTLNIGVGCDATDAGLKPKHGSQHMFQPFIILTESNF
jgi:hypothetical protein